MQKQSVQEVLEDREEAEEAQADWLWVRQGMM
jgi:hypothetical protein